jgi:hypothetical protein
MSSSAGREGRQNFRVNYRSSHHPLLCTYPSKPGYETVSRREFPEVSSHFVFSRARLIITLKCLARSSSSIMLAAEHYPDLFADVAPKSELLEVQRSKISLHRAKTGYYYPTIRLPHTFSKLAPIHANLQIIYDGSLAFLTAIAPIESASKHPKPPSSHGGGRRSESGRAHRSF